MIKKLLIGLSLLVAVPAFSFAQTAPLGVSTGGGSCMDFKIKIKIDAASANDAQNQLQLLSLQAALTKEGFSVDTSEFGKFGKTTRAAVKAFQEKYMDDVLAPFGLSKGTGIPGAITRMKLQALYGCRVESQASVPVPAGGVKLAVTNLVLDSNGVSATFCNQGTSDLTTAPFRIRLNGINRDFEAIGAQKAGACTSDTWKYDTWGLYYDPGSTFTAIALIDPNGVYKTNVTQFPLNASSTLSVPVLPGAHLSVRSVLLKSTGVQATFCNLGSTVLTSFPVRIVVNGTSKDFDVPEAYATSKCVPKTFTWDNWGITYMPGMSFVAKVTTDPDNKIVETNEFDNVASVIGTP